MIYTQLTKTALDICFDVHGGQRDKGGAPYVFHPFHVAEQMTTEAEVCVALLHDVLEDTDMTADELADAGMPDEVIEALRLLKHEDGVPYREYIEGLAGNRLARTVKRADLIHNMDTTRLEKVTEEDRERIGRYREALGILDGSDAGDLGR